MPLRRSLPLEHSLTTAWQQPRILTAADLPPDGHTEVTNFGYVGTGADVDGFWWLGLSYVSRDPDRLEHARVLYVQPRQVLVRTDENWAGTWVDPGANLLPQHRAVVHLTHCFAPRHDHPPPPRNWIYARYISRSVDTTHITLVCTVLDLVETLLPAEATPSVSTYDPWAVTNLVETSLPAESTPSLSTYDPWA